MEGETLENLIKRSGRLEVKLALEIATQVAAGLAAVHEQNLVHRDIKPTNIMVTLKEGRSVTAKIIDLGLAKPRRRTLLQTAISTPGGFCRNTGVCQSRAIRGGRRGHPLRSVLAWRNTLGDVDGQNAIPGDSREVMYQHQHAPLPRRTTQRCPAAGRCST